MDRPVSILIQSRELNGAGPDAIVVALDRACADRTSSIVDLGLRVIESKRPPLKAGQFLTAQGRKEVRMRLNPWVRTSGGLTKTFPRAEI